MKNMHRFEQVLIAIGELPLKILGIAFGVVMLTLLIGVGVPFVYGAVLFVLLGAVGLVVDFFLNPDVVKFYFAGAFLIACFLISCDFFRSREPQPKVRRGRRITTPQRARRQAIDAVLKERAAGLRRRKK